MSKEAFFARHKPHKLFLTGTVLSLAFYLTVISINKYNTEDQIARRFQENFLLQQSLLLDKMPGITKILDGDQNAYWPLLERFLNQEGIFSQIFKNDSLLFWNNSEIATDYATAETQEGGIVVLTGTGWYLTQYQIYKDYTICLFKKIKSEYAVRNPYLPHAVQNQFSNYENIQLSLDTVQAPYQIRDRNGNAVLGLGIPQPILLSRSSIFLLFSLFIAIYLVALLWVESLYEKLKLQIKSSCLTHAFFVLDVIILRLFDYFFGFPAVLKESFLFEINPSGLPGFASAGDQVLNAVLLLFVVARLFRKTKLTGKKTERKLFPRHSLTTLFFVWLSSATLFYLIFHIVGQLPYSSLLAMLFSGFEGVAALLTIVLLLTVLYFVIVTLAPRLVPDRSLLISFFLLSFLLVMASRFVFPEMGFLLSVATVFMLFVMIILYFGREKKTFSTEKYLLLLILFSAATAIIVNHAEKEIRDNHQLAAAVYLSQTHEPALESGFLTVQQKIRQDEVVRNIVFNDRLDQDGELLAYLKEKYFVGFWKKYNLQLTICSTDEQLEIQPENVLVNCNDYFKALISDFGQPILDSSLFLLNVDPESIYYLGDIRLLDKDNQETQHHIHIEFFYSIIPKGLGYPELLVDQKFSGVDLTAYSFARYKNDKLVYKFGNLSYHTDFRFLRDFADNSFFTFLKYRHYKTEIRPGSYLVVSRPDLLLTERISTFSILFLIFGFVLFVAVLFLFGSKPENLFRFSFQTRLQFIFTGSIALIIMLLAIITMYYVKNNNEKDLQEQLNEKTYSVLIELQHKLGGEISLKDYDKEMLFQLLGKFSMVFFSDINLYDASGQLIATSRPEIFRKGLLSENINPLAFEELFVDNKLFYLTEEKIGTLAYYSSYVPLILNEDKPSGIINLPYFARQNEVRQSYYQMLFTFVNLFVILGIFGIFIALILSKVLTRPLQVLQKSLANIRIDKQNEKLNWSKNDEIGKLIEEYNRMIDKLEESAELLKHSERESAWREVARQIAHEIKNPLTPMKLNVQYLEKAYRENDTEFDAKIKSISASLIEQIDSLNNVAEMFADFSKSTTQNLEEVDLLAIIHSSVELFKNNRAVKIVVSSQNKPLKTRASSEGKDILRVFNNLIKNSIQSIPPTLAGKIDISVQTQQSWHIIRIADNGKGIDAATKNLIFQPYFTTKSGGTGLGLAIVKSIMNGVGGEIEFESEQGKGSIFTLKFKAVD
ncbi:MAG: HAMP domain-containing histidine kinase [Bacteroidales bacterium]|nr:HAMP domain-containing histidine kinase [Bacteroidales bacterium]